MALQHKEVAKRDQGLFSTHVFNEINVMHSTCPLGSCAIECDSALSLVSSLLTDLRA